MIWLLYIYNTGVVLTFLWLVFNRDIVRAVVDEMPGVNGIVLGILTVFIALMPFVWPITWLAIWRLTFIAREAERKDDR